MPLMHLKKTGLSRRAPPGPRDHAATEGGDAVQSRRSPVTRSKAAILCAIAMRPHITQLRTHWKCDGSEYLAKCTPHEMPGGGSL